MALPYHQEEGACTCGETLMRYHAVLTGIEGLPRPIGSYSSSIDTLKDWSTEVLRRYPKGEVVITREVPQIVEVRIARFDEDGDYKGSQTKESDGGSK